MSSKELLFRSSRWITTQQSLSLTMSSKIWKWLAVIVKRPVLSSSTVLKSELLETSSTCLERSTTVSGCVATPQASATLTTMSTCSYPPSGRSTQQNSNVVYSGSKLDPPRPLSTHLVTTNLRISSAKMPVFTHSMHWTKQDRPRFNLETMYTKASSVKRNPSCGSTRRSKHRSRLSRRLLILCNVAHT